MYGSERLYSPFTVQRCIYIIYKAFRGVGFPYHFSSFKMAILRSKRHNRLTRNEETKKHFRYDTKFI